LCKSRLKLVKEPSLDVQSSIDQEIKNLIALEICVYYSFSCADYL